MGKLITGVIVLVIGTAVFLGIVGLLIRYLWLRIVVSILLLLWFGHIIGEILYNG